MSGETDLNKLIASMSPVLNEGTFVFCTLAKDFSFDVRQVLAFFKEEEGMTLVLKKELAEEWKLQHSVPMAWLSLNVYSSLQAVGLTATVAKVLADAGISCNVLAAYYHDHIFVEKDKAQMALQLLTELSKK